MRGSAWITVLNLVAPLSMLACRGQTTGDTAPQEEGRGAGECSDGADNDGDGAFDCDDTGCEGSPDCDGGNSPPSAPTISVIPQDPTDDDALNCIVDGESVDPDGDAVTYTYAWYVDGVSAEVTATTVGPELTQPGEEWTCHVRATDGELISSEATASVRVSDTYRNAAGARMVLIPGGAFQMGDTRNTPVRDVTLTSGFWIAQTETTQSEWYVMMGERPSFFIGDDFPVEQVSWSDAALYANALSTSEGLDRCYAADGSDLDPLWAGDPYACEGYRLPTEAEWEYAARAGDEYVYAGSDTAEDVAWILSNSGGTTHVVGGRTENAFGLVDMSGNVFEWVHDWHGEIAPGDAFDPAGPSSGSVRVKRGGGYAFGPELATVANRSSDSPTYRSSNIGFRIVRTFRD